MKNNSLEEKTKLIIQSLVLCESSSTSSDSSTSDDSSDSTDSDEMHSSSKRRKIIKTSNFIENVVRMGDDQQFREHFRLSREAVQFLTNMVESASVLPDHIFGREKITSEKGMLMTIWYLANQETYRQISSRFNVARSSAYICIKKIIDYMVLTRQRFIKWPNRQEIDATIVFFAKKGMKGAIGAIDGSHILIPKPKVDQEAYCNRKGQHSIILQGVSNHRKEFIDVFCGEAGSVHDAKVLRRSGLFRILSHSGIEGNRYLLGDSAYPSLSWLVPPFRDNGLLTNQEREFNYKHSSCRIVIENTFGLLKGRFRRLFGFQNRDTKFVVKAVITACIFHNIALQFDPTAGDDEILPDTNQHEPDVNEIIDQGVDDNTQIDRRRSLFNEMYHT